MIVFGPIQSRRLGSSLGINNIPPKHCSYACVYCQVGATDSMQINFQAFYEPEEIVTLIKNKVKLVQETGQQVDYLTFVPDGEPTLDLNLKNSLAILKSIGLPLAVISNGSLIKRQEVQNALALADWVSLKVDSVNDSTWRKVNRPHGQLRLKQILDGMLDFSQNYAGQLVTETMLVGGVNDDETSINDLVIFLKKLNPQTAYIGLPIRPPCENWVKIPQAFVINRVYQQFNDQLPNVELLGDIDPHPFVSRSAFEEELLSIVAVHPLNQSTVQQMTEQSGVPWEKVRRMVQENKLQMVNYGGTTFYLCGYERKP